MQTGENIKRLVKGKYGEIAEQSSGCGCGCGSSADNVSFDEDYTRLEGYDADANLGLGCGLPTEFAKIQEGDTVLDLGSGAGNDCFVARALVGEAGEVIGVDMTEAMIDKARQNAARLNYENVAFHLGDIENLPVADNRVNVVVSNCVMNLVPDKQRAFAETFRVLKPGGHFSISDIVLQGVLPKGLMDAATMYTGCVAGALPKDAYLDVIRKAGFVNIKVQEERKMTLPDALVAEHLTPEEFESFKQSEVGVLSVTVYAEKPN